MKYILNHINNIQNYLPIFRDTPCCLGSYTCTVVFEAGNRVCNLLQYIHNHYQFDTLDCIVCLRLPIHHLSLHCVQEFNTQLINGLVVKRAWYPTRKPRVAVSIPGGDINFQFEVSACFPSLQLCGSLANEIMHDYSPVVIVVVDTRYDLSYKTCILKAAI